MSKNDEIEVIGIRKDRKATYKYSITKEQLQNKMSEIYERPIGDPNSYREVEALKRQLGLLLVKLATKELRNETKQ